jgi:hypothetical protein
MANKQAPSQLHDASNRVLRLTFSYEGSAVKLVSSQKVEMTLPPSHALAPAERESGFWFTLADKTGNPVYRRVVQNPIRFDKEVFSPGREGSLHREAVAKPRGSFVVLVPDQEDARTLMLFSHPLEPHGLIHPAKEFIRFDLSAEPGREKKQ